MPPDDPVLELDPGALSPKWIPQLTGDGSYTFFSQEFGEQFHTGSGAKAEAFSKFAAATLLQQKAGRSHLYLLDVCYGLGYNSAAALETIWQVNPDCQVTLYGLELDASVPLAATQPPLIDAWSPPVQAALVGLAQEQRYHQGRIRAEVLIGDARQTLRSLVQQAYQADAIFFDPFSPRRCPQLWTVEFFQLAARCLAPDGRLSTYSRAASVRAALQAVGLMVGTIPLPDGVEAPPHDWASGTVAAWPPEAKPPVSNANPPPLSDANLPPLSKMEQQHLLTRAAIPYRDPDLSDPAEMILARREAEQAASGAESTSQWRRRWGLQSGNRH
jgi:tRNA U34 5-methylaminomethyl-2-thiouridine-forming methyltransferase MnmC